MKLQKKDSYTLIELLVTFALIMVLMLLTLPNTTFFNRTLVINEINKLFAIFSYLQQRAITTNVAQELSINPIDNTYYFTINHKKQCIQTLSKQVVFGYQKGIKGPPANPTRPVTKPITFPEKNGVHRIKFTTNGKITPGTLYFTDKSYQFQGALTCPISQVSYIRRYFYENRRWECI